jgi:alpha/beta superfamily hydrolase
MRTELLIAAPAGHLEAIFDHAPDATRAVVLCHPHPQYGGSMHDAVVDTVDGVARNHGFATLKFNFRGVGASSGRFDQGVGEVDDLLAALTWLRERAATLPVWLAGYSFGSNIVWRALERAGEVAGILLIAPPIALMDFTARPTVGAPVAAIAGDRDDYVDATQLRSWAANATAGAAPTATVELIAGADHFFSGRYAALGQAAQRVLGR